MPADFNHVAAAIQALHVGSAKAVADVAAQIVARAKANAPVLTGNMRDSVYQVTPEGSTYQSGEKRLPELPAPDDGVSAIVAVAAEYADYVNGGTSRQAANPFFTSAVESVRGDLAKRAAAHINDALTAALG